MVKKVKSIDGFSARPNTKRRVVGIQDAPKKRGKKVRVSTAEDFVAPVGTLDLTSDDIERDLRKKKTSKKPAKKNKKQRKKWSKKKKTIVGIIVCLVLLLIGAGIFAHWYLSKLSDGNIGLWDVFTAKDVELKKGANGRTNILVLGTSGYEMDGSGHDGAQLTDSIMIVSLDQEAKDVALLSLPRDLKVGYTCTATGKVNEIYWCANQYGDDELAGVSAAEEEIGEILGIDFQYYAHMNWGALVQVVDAIGGVTVTLDEDIFDDWTNTFITAGEPTTLDGEEALGLARARHGTYAGDFTRGASQQKILMGIKDKVLGDGLSVGQLFDLMNAVGDNLRMDFSANELKTLYNMMGDFDMENIRQVSLLDADKGINLVTTGTINGISYVLPTAGEGNYSDIQDYIKQQFSSDAMTREGAVILVLNGSNEIGAASLEEERLDNKGFNVGDIDDAPEGSCAAKYCLYDLSDGEKPKTLKKLLKRYNLEEAQPADELPIYVYTNVYDFVLILGAAEE